MVWTLAYDTIGTVPRLQINTDREDVNRRIERAFRKWARAIELGPKLRTMRVGKCCDGEAIALYVTNERLKTPVKLDLKLVESDQLMTPFIVSDPSREADGVIFDGNGVPVAYRLLKSHPGSMLSGNFLETVVLAADRVIHYFRADRAGQHRGVPELATALPLVASARRYTTAVVAAAETAADYAAVLESQSVVDPESNEDASKWDGMELTPRMLATLPAGWKLSQLKAEQPATTYNEFISALTGQKARCIQMPENVALGNSSRWNFASGRLDHLKYHNFVWIEREFIEMRILEPLLMEWFREAVLIDGLLPPEAREIGVDFDEILPHEWHFDAFDAVDEAKAATAQETRLRTGVSSYAEECQARNVDWRDLFRQRKREQDFADSIGLRMPSLAPAAVAPAGDDEEEEPAAAQPTRGRR